MDNREKPHTDKCKEIMYVWNYDTSCTLTSLRGSDLEKCLIVLQSVHKSINQSPHGIYLQKPLNHMPNVVKVITERAGELAAMDKVVYYFSPKVSLVFG
jgi:hypothetical protein